MENGLYHCEVYWEDNIQSQIDAALNSGLPIRFAEHAINKKDERKISVIGITIEKLKKAYCFEAEVKNNKVIKFVVRYGYNDIYDLASVWQPNNDCLFCKTIWLNKKDDKHITLDETKYVKNKNVKNIQHASTNLGDLIKQLETNKKD